MTKEYRYVVGFLFSSDDHQVLLLRKEKPKWQAGKLNGMGGHVEPGETFDQAMDREGFEESGLKPDWEHFAILSGADWEMHAYRASSSMMHEGPWRNDVGELFEIRTPQAVAMGWVSTIPNLQWLVPMAMMKNRKDWPYRIEESPSHAQDS